jgi:hypothetical protein
MPPQPMRLKGRRHARQLRVRGRAEERTIGALLDLVGEDRILWGDHPHIDSTLAARALSGTGSSDPALARGGAGGPRR